MPDRDHERRSTPAPRLKQSLVSFGPEDTEAADEMQEWDRLKKENPYKTPPNNLTTKDRTRAVPRRGRGRM